MMSNKWFGRNWGSLFSSMSLVTSLSEALEWDDKLAEHLFKSWSMHFIDLFTYDRSAAILLMSAYLPDDKKHLEESLVSWLHMNFTPATSKADEEIH